MGKSLLSRWMSELFLGMGRGAMGDGAGEAELLGIQSFLRLIYVI